MFLILKASQGHIVNTKEVTVSCPECTKRNTPKMADTRQI